MCLQQDAYIGIFVLYVMIRIILSKQEEDDYPSSAECNTDRSLLGGAALARELDYFTLRT